MPDVRTTTHFAHHLERDDGRQTTIALIEHYTIIVPGEEFRTERFILEVTDQARDFSDEGPSQSIPLSLAQTAALAESFTSAVAEMIRLGIAPPSLMEPVGSA